MQKMKILSEAKLLFIPGMCLCYEVAGILLCCYADVEKMLAHTLMTILSVMLCAAFLLANRRVTVVVFNPEKEIVTRRGLFVGFYREIRIADINRSISYIRMPEGTQCQDLTKAASRNLKIFYTTAASMMQN